MAMSMKKDQDLYHIRETYRDLTTDIVNSLKIGNIMDALFQERIIHEEEYKKICNLVHANNSTEANRLFLTNTLLKDLDPNTFKKFLKLLENSQQYLAKKLQQTYELICQGRNPPTSATPPQSEDPSSIQVAIQETENGVPRDHSTTELAMAALKASNQTDEMISDNSGTNSDLGTQQLSLPVVAARNEHCNEPKPNDNDQQESPVVSATSLSHTEQTEPESILPKSRNDVTDNKEPSLATAEVASNNASNNAPPAAAPTPLLQTVAVAANNAQTPAPQNAEVAANNESLSQTLEPMALYKIDPKKLGFNRDDPIGHGRFGEVFSCDYSGTHVAVKEIKGVGKDVEKFLGKCRELKACIKIQHQCIVLFMGYSTAEFARKPSLLLVFEYIEGHSLQKLLHDWDENEIFPLDNTAKNKIAEQLATAITYIHGKHLLIIHGDIKPENVLITLQNNVKLCDLGLCKIKRGNRANTTIGKPRGTPIYMAPELLLGNDWYSDLIDRIISFESDVFSLGVTLYELFDQKYMWGISTDLMDEEDSMSMLLEKMTSRDLPEILKDPQGRQPYTIIAQCVCHAPKDRPKAAEVLDALTGKSYDQQKS